MGSGRVDKTSLKYLGEDFQVRFIVQILTDKQFGSAVLDIVKSSYFEDLYYRKIVSAIKDAYDEYEIIPNINTLQSRLLESANDEIEVKHITDYVNKIKECDLYDGLWVQKTAMNFCKQQELQRSINEIQKIINKGDVNNFYLCEELIKKALEVGDTKDDGCNVLDDIDDALAEDYRHPIPTGISELDEIMNGGLSKGELGLVLAAFGVGKTTILTKFANSAKDNGYNVLQIFFEDIPKVIKRKHLACWSGYDMDELPQHKEELKELIKQKGVQGGVLRLKKFPSHGTTVPAIKKYIRKKIAEGFIPDLVIIDYIDCVHPSKHYDDVNVGEGAVMREIETMLDELNVAGWVGLQGNRSSIKAAIVESDQMSGSIKKGMIGHFIMSIAKTLEQKENGTANAAILKSRFGKDGFIFNDIIFNNSNLNIDFGNTDGAMSRSEFSNVRMLSDQDRVRQIMERNQALNGN